MNILIINHFDSFIYNIYDIFRRTNNKIFLINYKLKNNNIIKIIFYKPLICIGSGQGGIKKYKTTFFYLKQFYRHFKFLGICLGHQIISSFFGFIITKANHIVHGKKVKIILNKKIFFNFPKSIFVIRYNSLIAKKIKKTTSKIIAFENKTKEIMIIYNKKFNTVSFQFHIDSIFTYKGLMIIKKFLNNYV